MSFFIKYKNIFVIFTVLIFVGSLGFVGAGVFMEEYGPNSALAIVGKNKIKVKDFEARYEIVKNNLRESDQEYDEAAQTKLKQQVIQTMISEESMAQSALKYGVGVCDKEIAYSIRTSFSLDGLFNKEAYVWTVRNRLGMNPSDYEAMLKKQILAAKFQNMLILGAKVSPQEAAFFADAQRGTDKDKSKESDKNETPQTDADAVNIAVLQLKAQSLADEFAKQFNSRERVELKTVAGF
jgi:hypothetical protein